MAGLRRQNIFVFFLFPGLILLLDKYLLVENLRVWGFSDWLPSMLVFEAVDFLLEGCLLGLETGVLLDRFAQHGLLLGKFWGPRETLEERRLNCVDFDFLGIRLHC